MLMVVVERSKSLKSRQSRPTRQWLALAAGWRRARAPPPPGRLSGSTLEGASMQHRLSGLTDRLARLVLPRTTAQAACTEYFNEYETVACSRCAPLVCRNKRTCHYCNGKKSCSAWTFAFCHS
jgi:hypothetical protein